MPCVLYLNTRAQGAKRHKHGSHARDKDQEEEEEEEEEEEDSGAVVGSLAPISCYSVMGSDLSGERS